MDKKQLGMYGELMAARYLRKHGYTILEPNFHSRFGEIDLVAKIEDTIVFVEVKTRTEDFYHRPAEAVNLAKQQKIKKTAMCFLNTLDCEVNVRFDVVEVVAITCGQKKVKINHIQSAFE